MKTSDLHQRHMRIGRSVADANLKNNRYNEAYRLIKGFADPAKTSVLSVEIARAILMPQQIPGSGDRELSEYAQALCESFQVVLHCA